VKRNRPKQFIFVKTVVKEIVQRIRNPLNALQLNIDSLEDDIARANIENGLERLKRIGNTKLKIKFLQQKLSFLNQVCIKLLQLHL